MHLVWGSTTTEMAPIPFAWEFPDFVNGMMLMIHTRLSVSLCLVLVQALALPTVTTTKTITTNKTMLFMV